MANQPPRRFPPPWRADKIAGGYVVRGRAFVETIPVRLTPEMLQAIDVWCRRNKIESRSQGLRDLIEKGLQKYEVRAPLPFGASGHCTRALQSCSYLAASIHYASGKGYMHRDRTRESAALPGSCGGKPHGSCQNDGPNGSPRPHPICATLRDTG
jgi:hypothetical protein